MFIKTGSYVIKVAIFKSVISEDSYVGSAIRADDSQQQDSSNSISVHFLLMFVSEFWFIPPSKNMLGLTGLRTMMKDSKSQV